MPLMEQKKLLTELLKSYSFAEIGVKLGVTETTVRRWYLEKHQAHRIFLKAIKRLERGNNEA